MVYGMFCFLDCSAVCHPRLVSIRKRKAWTLAVARHAPLLHTLKSDLFKSHPLAVQHT